MVVPPLEFGETYPLLDTLQSRLTVLRKRDLVTRSLPAPA
jgi:hypothetical protein